MYKIIQHKRKKEKYLQRNFYIRICLIKAEEVTSTRLIEELYSYKTKIGYYDMKRARVYTWGYGRYSTTTSVQITKYCKEHHAIRYDIKRVSLKNFINNIME